MATLTAYASSFNNAIPTGFTGGQFTNPTNAVGSTEANYATAAPGTAGPDFGNHYFFNGFSSIPDGSTINSITLEVRHFASFAARGTFGYRLDSAANTAIANEVTATTVGNVAPAAGQPGTNGVFTTFSSLPTLTQLKAATFGVRARFQRTGNTVTSNIDWIRITVDYTPPVTTVQGAVAIMSKGGIVATQKGSSLSPVYFSHGAFSSDADQASPLTMWLQPSVWDDFIATSNSQPLVAAWYQSWGDDDRDMWEQAKVDHFTARGEVPFISWAPRTNATGATDPTYNHAAILAGTHDAYLDQWAADLVAYGKTVIMGPMWEMNLNVFPWCVGVQGQTTTSFINAWRYIVDRVRAGGATKVRWAWIPYHASSGLAQYYPGDNYVDIVGVDAFNGMGTETWQTPETLFRGTYNHITGTVAPTKPFMIKETGSFEKVGESKGTWIRQLFDLPKTMPKLRLILWFNADRTSLGERDWTIESSADALTAYREVTSEPLANQDFGLPLWAVDTIAGKATVAVSGTSSIPPVPVQGTIAIAGKATLASTSQVRKQAAAVVASSATVAAAGQIGASQTTRSFVATFDGPSSPLVPGPNRSKFVVKVRKKAAATENPVVKLELLEAEGGPVLSTVVAGSEITSTSWVNVEGDWDADLLPSLEPDTVHLRVVNTTPGSAPALDIAAIDWYYDSQPLGYTPLHGGSNILGQAAASIQAVKGVRSGSVIQGGAASVIQGVAAKRGAFSVAGLSTLSATARKALTGQVPINGSQTLITVQGIAAKRANMVVSANAQINLGGVGPRVGSATLSGAAQAAISAIVARRGAVNIGAGSVGALSGRLSLTAAVPILGGASVSANALKALTAALSINGQGSVVPVVFLLKSGAATIASQAAVIVDGEAVLVPEFGFIEPAIEIIIEHPYEGAQLAIEHPYETAQLEDEPTYQAQLEVDEQLVAQMAWEHILEAQLEIARSE